MTAPHLNTPTETLMRREIVEIPDVIDRLLSEGEKDISKAAANIRERSPSLFLSIARGSSDHACTYLKYACELILRRPMASIGPSVKSIYGLDLMADNAVALAVSQSGTSPDIVQMTASIKSSGGLALALTNSLNSELSNAASVTLPLFAGPEKSVAATKSFVASLVAGLLLIAHVKQDQSLINAIHVLPCQLAQAVQCDWSLMAHTIEAGSLFVIGRGPSAAIADEAALKFKETCLIHAESYSSAEVLHGPVSIVGSNFPILAFAAGDAAEDSLAQSADDLSSKGGAVFATTDKVKKAKCLPHIRTNHWLTDPIAIIVSFYAMVETIARNRGINPDTPRHLQKVTETV